MIVDCHVHVFGFTPVHGGLSPRLREGLLGQFLQWQFGMDGADIVAERTVEQTLAELIDSSDLDAAVVLAFDGVYDRSGKRDDANTHFYVSNDYVMELCRRHEKMLFGASINPYRNDAVAELERCIGAGAALVKWLPLVQGFDPSDQKCFPFYEALAQHKLPLLSHTGGEQSLPRREDYLADPMLLIPALERGVTVIAAHCCTRSFPSERDYLPEFLRLARDYENFYGDTAALNLPARWHAYDAILGDEQVRAKLVHGSDWPIPPIPPAHRIGVYASAEAMTRTNWIQRDIDIKRKLGFDEAYWQRAAKLLQPQRAATVRER